MADRIDVLKCNAALCQHPRREPGKIAVEAQPRDTLLARLTGECAAMREWFAGYCRECTAECMPEPADCKHCDIPTACSCPSPVVARIEAAVAIVNARLGFSASVEYCETTNYGNTSCCPECGAYARHKKHRGDCEWGAAWAAYRAAATAREGEAR